MLFMCCLWKTFYNSAIASILCLIIPVQHCEVYTFIYFDIDCIFADVECRKLLQKKVFLKKAVDGRWWLENAVLLNML